MIYPSTFPSGGLVIKRPRVKSGKLGGRVAQPLNADPTKANSNPAATVDVRKFRRSILSSTVDSLPYLNY